MSEIIITRLMDENKELLSQIEILKNEISNLSSKSLYQSDQLNELAPAFAKAKLDFKSLHKGSLTTNGWKYAKLNEVLDIADEGLGKQGIVLYFYLVAGINDERILKTRLLHASGQWIESFSRIIPKANTHQAIGEAITYQKRYSAMCILGVAPSDDATDDDGEKDALVNMAKNQREGKKVDSKIADIPLNQTQIDELNYELKGYPELAESLLKNQDVHSFADIKQTDFVEVIQRVRKIKKHLDTVDISQQ